MITPLNKLKYTYIGLHIRFLLFCPILTKFEFSGIFMKIRLAGAELFHANGRT